MYTNVHPSNMQPLQLYSCDWLWGFIAGPDRSAPAVSLSSRLDAIRQAAAVKLRRLEDAQPGVGRLQWQWPNTGTVRLMEYSLARAVLTCSGHGDTAVSPAAAEAAGRSIAEDSRGEAEIRSVQLIVQWEWPGSARAANAGMPNAAGGMVNAAPYQENPQCTVTATPSVPEELSRWLSEVLTGLQEPAFLDVLAVAVLPAARLAPHLDPYRPLPSGDSSAPRGSEVLTLLPAPAKVQLAGMTPPYSMRLVLQAADELVAADVRLQPEGRSLLRLLTANGGHVATEEALRDMLRQLQQSGLVASKVPAPGVEGQQQQQANGDFHRHGDAVVQNKNLIGVFEHILARLNASQQQQQQ